MSKPKDRLLPLKLSLELAALELGLSDISRTEQHSIVHQYQRDFDLTIRLGGHYKFSGQMVSDGLDATIDTNGNHIFLTQGDSFWFDSSTDEVALDHFLLIGDDRVLISSVIVKGVKYYVIDEPGMHPKAIGCHLQDVYIDKEDLVDFRDGKHRTVPEWADPSSDLWAPELALAVKLHKALRIDGDYPDGTSMKKRVESWIDEHMPNDKVSGDQIKRIASVIGNARQQRWPNKR